MPLALAFLLFLVLPSPSPSFAYSASAEENIRTIDTLEVGAFNIQVFGESKFNKPHVLNPIVQILSRYDIVFIQEIRDDKGQAILKLLEELRAATGRDYQATISPRLGRGEMKEQYAYFYDTALVRKLEAYVFPDAKDDFSREPYVARFQGLGHEFTLAGIHMAPNEVRKELRALADVQRESSKRFGDNNLFILGDFNADCIYYKPKEGFDFFDMAPIVMITDDVDTTVSPVACAYDRILGFGEILAYASDGRAFNFMEAMNFDLATAKLVSDHFPIEFTLKGLNSDTAPGNDWSYPLPPLDEEPNGDEPLECGLRPYLTPAGYCYSEFENKGKRRVADACCL